MAVEIAVVGGVGLILDHCFNRAEGLIDQAGNRADLLALKAGIELRKTIEHARIAYSDSLDKTMDRVDDSVRDAITHIADVANQVQMNNERLARTLARDAQMLFNTLPLSNSCPQLISFSPRYVVVTDPARRIRFHCLGNFVNAASAEYPHTLQFNNSIAELVDNTTTRLTFRIAVRDLFDPRALAASNTYSYSTGHLRASWPGPAPALTIGGILNGLYRTVAGTRAEAPIALFKMTVGALPPSPGVITLEYKTFKWGKKREKQEAKERHLDSRTYDGGTTTYETNVKKGGYGRDEVMDFTVTAREGWTIEPGTATVPSVLTTFSGNTNLTFVGATEKMATFRAETKSGMFGTGGCMDFSIHYTEWRDVRVINETISQNIRLGWAGEHTFTPTKDWDEGWTVSFRPFDSEISEDFTPATLPPQEHDRFSIRRVGSDFTIRPKIPAELVEDDDN
jgi:hypothetical protein